jgi:hypothetical protein
MKKQREWSGYTETLAFYVVLHAVVAPVAHKSRMFPPPVGSISLLFVNKRNCFMRL